MLNVGLTGAAAPKEVSSDVMLNLSGFPLNLELFNCMCHNRQFMALDGQSSDIPFVIDLHRLLNRMQVTVLPTP